MTERVIAPGRPKPPASSAALMSRGSSSRTSGLPRLSAMIRSRTCSSSRPGTAVASRALASSWPSPSSRSSGRPATWRSSLGSRTANTIATRSASSRRATNPSTCRRGVVEPLEVVDETQQGLLLGELREQRERRQADEEAVGRIAGREPERHAQRVPLRRRERVDAATQRRAELMQSRERQLHLGLDAGDLHDPEARGLTGGVPQQRRLADPGLTADHEHAAAAPRARPRAAGPAPGARWIGRGTPAGAGRRAIAGATLPVRRPGTFPGATSARSRDRAARTATPEGGPK